MAFVTYRSMLLASATLALGVGFLSTSPGCISCTAVGGFDGLYLFVESPATDEDYTIVVQLEASKAKHQGFIEADCTSKVEGELRSVTCVTADASEQFSGRGLADVTYSVGLDDAHAMDFMLYDSRAESVTVSYFVDGELRESQSIFMLDYGDPYYPNGKECDGEGYRSANVEVALSGGDGDGGTTG